MYYIIIFILSLPIGLFPAYELSSTQKLLLREKVGNNVYAWDDHDSKTISALFLVDKDLNRNIQTVRDSLIKKFPQFPLVQSAIVCNRFGEWCAFKQNDARDRVDIFFGSQDRAQSDYLYDTNLFESLYIEPVTYGENGSFLIQLNKDRFSFLLISPEKKRVLKVWDSSAMCMDSFLDSCGITLPSLKRALPYLAGSVFKKVAYDDVGYFTYRSGKRADSVEDVQLIFDSRDFYSKALFVLAPKLLTLQAHNSECVCTPESIDDKCKLRYEALGSVFSQEDLFLINHESYDRSHCFSLIGKNPSQTKSFYTNSFGQIFMTDAALKSSDDIGTVNILKPKNWDQLIAPQRAAWCAKQCFIVGDIACYRNHTQNLLTICARRDSGGFIKTNTYKFLLPHEVRILDGVEQWGACHLLVEEKNGSNEFALISCDIHDSFARDPKIQDFRFNTIEAARDHYYRNRHRSSYPGFDQQCIRGPEIVLKTLIEGIRNDYGGPIKELTKEPISVLRFPVYNSHELTYNGQTTGRFQPKGFIDRAWYATQLKITDLPRDMKRESLYALGAFGSVLFAWGSLIRGAFYAGMECRGKAWDIFSLVFPILLFGVGMGHHGLKNDEAKCDREFSTFGKVWPYPLFCLMGYASFNSLKSQLLYATLPAWFHLYDRLGMFIKPPTVYVPFNRLYNAFPTRMRQTIHEKWRNSNTFYAAIIKYLLGA